MSNNNIANVKQAQEFSMSVASARQLASTTKSDLQMPGISPRSLLKVLPWVETKGGAYQVNRVSYGTDGYDILPRVYELNAVRTIMRIPALVADLMDQTEQQLKLIVDLLREEQEKEMINNTDFGLLHSVDERYRISTRSGGPTPDDFDTLLTRIRNPQVLLAHPKTIAALAYECNRLGIYPQSVELGGQMVPAWRSVPLLPCSKLPISEQKTTSVIVLRLGEENEGVIGLRQTGLPDEYEPGLNVRFMNVDEKGTISYLVSTYFSVAALVPDALGVLENIELGR